MPTSLVQLFSESTCTVTAWKAPIETDRRV